MIQITATDFKTNLGKYLTLVSHEDIYITKNGADIAVLSAPKAKRGWIDDLIGVIPSSDVDIRVLKADRLAGKYESLD
jgi:prevent-host-death family protein